jgi:thiamine biosynthesis lipoprotein
MMTATAAATRVTFPIWGTTAVLVVEDPASLVAAEDVLRAELEVIDRACSRFRDDSEISLLHMRAGRGCTVSVPLSEAIEVAMRAAELTDGLVDPTIGAAVRHLGYDRDFGAVPPDGPPLGPPRPAPGWWRVSWEPRTRRILLPRGVLLDLGATAKALAADRAASQIADQFGCGALVGLGGDIAVAGPPPPDGWRIGVADDHTRADHRPDTTVAISGGGLATSSTVRRRWRRGERVVHHIVDPRTGDLPDSPWRTVSVTAGSCVDANTASTAALVRGSAAPGWLERAGLPARLVGHDGEVVTVAGWPAPGGRD